MKRFAFAFGFCGASNSLLLAVSELFSFPVPLYKRQKMTGPAIPQPKS
jgi:hypothetical protein